MRSVDVTRVLHLISALMLFAAPVAAAPQDQDVFTNFENVSPNTAIGEIIEVGSSPEVASFSGDAFGGVVGIGQLYHSGLRAWMVTANGTGFIDFETDAIEVEFWATANSLANGNTVITAFDDGGVMVGSLVTLTPGSGYQLVSFSGPIASIMVVNNATINQLNAIDDFGFTVVPEPGATSMLLSGGALLAALGRRRRAAASQDILNSRRCNSDALKAQGNFEPPHSP